MPWAAEIFFGIAFFGLAVTSFAIGTLAWWRRSPSPPASRHVGISVLKPLCGLDDELESSLESHLHFDYPGDWEILLGLKSSEDPAYPIAERFARAHPDRVRLCLQRGSPGHNPKVNQLITLTEQAAYEAIAVIDSSVRTGSSTLREIAGVLDRPRVGIAFHVIAGDGERTLGAVLDNLTSVIFVAPSLVAAQFLGFEQVLGKSMSMRKADLAKAGGWEVVKDVLAEDSGLGRHFRRLGMRAAVCPTPLTDFQASRTLAAFWERQVRWYVIRYRNAFPLVLFEPILFSSVWAFLGVALGWRSIAAWWLMACVLGFEIVLAQLGAYLTRGKPFRLRHVLLNPLREVLFLAAWFKGAFTRNISWRGNRFTVLWGTQLLPAGDGRRAA